MCEVGSCCGCISLYKGCIVIGVITMLASISQVLVFSFILYASYDSSAIASTVNTTANEEDVSSYSFHSPLCPFGFVPLALPPKNETFNSTKYAEMVNGNLTGPIGINISQQLTIVEPNTTAPALDLNCIAPAQGVLWAIVFVSGFYLPVGAILIIGVKKGVSCLLSTWFFYTVGYNLLCLIVALTDGVYTGAGDVSSYVVCMVTAYCIIVVDSYYEKLLRHERAVQSASSHPRPSLAVIKSTPVSPTSPESSPVYNPPIGKFMTVPPGYAPPGEASDLLLPSRASPSRDISQA